MPVTDVKPPQQRSTTRTKTGRGGRGSKSTAAVDRSSTPVIIEDEDSKDALATSANGATSVVNSGIPDQTLASTEVNSLYPGLNDMADALEALPMELIRHFTLLREIDAKCIVTMPELNRLIKDLFKLPIPEPTEVQLVQEREQILTRIRQLIRELMPCLEEKMHVAGVAAEAISRHVARLDYDYDELIIGQNEIPHIVRYGPKEHPAYLPIITPAEQKPLSSSRSESRREAMAAKKAAAAAAKADAATHTDGNGSSTRGGARGTPRPDEKVSGSGSKSNSSTRGTSGSGSKSSSGAGSKHSTSHATTNTNKRRKAASAASTPVVESAELAGNDSKVGMPNGDSVKSEYGDDVDSSVATSSKRSRNGNGSTSSRKRGAHGNGVSANVNSESLRSSRASKSNGKNNDEKPSSSGTSSNRRRGGSNSSNKRGEDYEEFDDYEEEDVQDEGDANEEQVYCYCQQVSFGEMVGCDGPDCKIEWFHLPCIGLSQPPVGQWFCNDCAKKREKGDGKSDSGGKSDADKKDESKTS